MAYLDFFLIAHYIYTKILKFQNVLRLYIKLNQYQPGSKKLLTCRLVIFNYGNVARRIVPKCTIISFKKSSTQYVCSFRDAYTHLPIIMDSYRK